MIALRFKPLLLAGLALAGSTATPAMAQDYEGIVRIMAECAKIGEISARVACYDNTMARVRLDGPVAAAPAAPVAAAQPTVPATPAQAAAAQAARPTGFGAESVVIRDQQAAEEAGPQRVEAKVARAVQTEPGIYIVTLEDGAQWRFLQDVPDYFNPPRAGSTVELRRSAMGGFMMKVGSQQPVRVQRIR